MNFPKSVLAPSLKDFVTGYNEIVMNDWWFFFCRTLN